MQANIKITLKSDFCVASGYSYAGIIDSDICCNENGIPYIPARRIKGCLREAAELINCENTEKIFGIKGNNISGALIIGNAYPEDYTEINNDILELKKLGYGDELTSQKILEQFSYIKAQTAIDNETGIAKRNSLRYTRVVNQYSPFNKEEMCFIANIEIPECYYEDIEKVSKALRHMGLNRNRGLGNVRCYIDRNNNNNDDDDSNNSINDHNITNDNDKIIYFDYVVENITPLMLSGESDEETERYIRGQSVIGALASKYLSFPCKSADDELFYNLFLSGKVKYTNLYITKKQTKNDNSEPEYKSFFPAPLFINEMKKSKKLVNVTKADSKNCFGSGEDYSPEHGNQPKKLKNKFIHITDDKKSIIITKPILDIVYHHSKRETYSSNVNHDENTNGILYTLETIRENQYFRGSIIGEKRYIDIIRKLICDSTLRFGKSKSAQYGMCKIVKSEPNESNFFNKVSVKKGEKIFVVFESDGVFINETNYTVRCDDITELIAKSLNILYDKNYNKNIYLQTTTITGYNTMWNLKKISFPAVKAGSVISFSITDDTVINTEFVGEKNTEGFGKIRIYKESELPTVFEEYEDKNDSNKDEDDSNKEKKEYNISSKAYALLEMIMFDSFFDAVKENSLATRKINLSPSTLGRITLMLRESVSAYKDNSIEAFEDFKKRLDSVKREEEKKEAAKFLSEYICEDKIVSMVETVKISDMKLDVKKVIGSSSSASYKIYNKMKNFGIKDIEKKITIRWSEYLMNILTYQKYAAKEV